MMSSSNITNEKMYQTTMHFVRKMLYDGIISEVEYSQINTIFIQKYSKRQIPIVFLRKFLKSIISSK